MQPSHTSSITTKPLPSYPRTPTFASSRTWRKSPSHLSLSLMSNRFFVVQRLTLVCASSYVPLSSLSTQPSLASGLIIRTARLRQRLGLTAQQMRTLAAAAGNDITSPVLRKQGTHSQLRVQTRALGAAIDKVADSFRRPIRTHNAHVAYQADQDGWLASGAAAIPSCSGHESLS